MKKSWTSHGLWYMWRRRFVLQEDDSGNLQLRWRRNLSKILTSVLLLVALTVRFSSAKVSGGILFSREMNCWLTFFYVRAGFFHANVVAGCNVRFCGELMRWNSRSRCFGRKDSVASRAETKQVLNIFPRHNFLLFFYFFPARTRERDYFPISWKNDSQVASTHSSDLVKQRIRFCIVYPLFEFLSP